jgi:hypothetical protein
MTKQWLLAGALGLLLGTFLAARALVGSGQAPKSPSGRAPPARGRTEIERCVGDHYCMSRVAGSPGTLVTASGAAVGRNEGGLRVHDTMAQLWWELDPRRAVNELRLGSPTPRLLERATLVGQQAAGGLREFHIRFRVPQVGAGTYRLIEVLYGGGGWTTLTFRFRVL